MDKISHDILTQLLNNPEKPFLRISEELGISPMTVIDRYEKMKKEGMIIGTSVIIDLAKIGYQGKAFLHITKTDNQCPKMIVETLKEIPNVFLISEIIGAFDLLAMVAFRNLKEVKEIVNKIRAESCVAKVETSITDDTSYPITQEFAEIRL